MDDSDHDTDWSLIQSFLAVADHGSLSAAARQLGRSQPTLGRQIHALETSLGTDLFERHARGLRLSDAGADLLPMARQMHAAMNALSLTAAGQSQTLAGTVRITASVFASHYVLPPVLAHIRAQEPSINLVLIPTDRPENLLFREADIAVRMYRPTQMDIVTRHITTLELGIFAAKSYLQRAGRPQSVEELMDFDLIGYDNSDLIMRTMRDMGWPATREDFVVRCDNQSAYWELVRAGCGIGFSQRNVGRADPLLEELDFGLSIPPLEVWLAAHQAMRQTPRIRRVWDLLADGLDQSEL
ncbi:LysR family transcriptional regulator [Arenibacterium sp. CAU 1754]